MACVFLSHPFPAFAQIILGVGGKPQNNVFMYQLCCVVLGTITIVGFALGIELVLRDGYGTLSKSLA